MKRFFTLLKIEGKIALRGIDAILFGVLMPIGIAILIALIAGDKASTLGNNISFLEENIPALLTVGICATAFMGIPLGLADYRDKKILKHYFVTPISPIMLLMIHVMINMITAIFSSIGVLLVMKIFFGYEIRGNWGMVVLSYFLVMISMYSLGMLVASLCKTVKRANLVCTIIYFPMLFLSGATVPFLILPESIRAFANLFPLTQGIKLLQNYALGLENHNIFISLIIIIVLGILSAILSVKYFRWE